MSQSKTELEKLIDKAEKTRNAHFLLYEVFRVRATLLHSSILVGSSVVAILTFADYTVFHPIYHSLTKEGLTLFVGILASIVFILTVLEEFTRWREEAQKHEDIGKQLTTYIRMCDGLKKTQPVTLEDLVRQRERYAAINESAPSIPDKYFFKAKIKLLRKVEISKEIDKNPFESIRSIKKRIRK